MLDDQDNSPTPEMLAKGVKRAKLPEDMTTPERLQHDQIVAVETIVAGVKAGRVRDPLDYYQTRGELDGLLYEVARDYGALRYAAGVVPAAKACGMDGRVDGSASSGGLLNPSERRYAAMQKLKRTDAEIVARASQRHVDVLAAVCAEGWSAAAWATSAGYRKNGIGLAFFRDAAEILALVWGRK
ncbi:MAG: hypothetical protein WC869_11920 [Phycisphaerae bacterium]